MLFEARTWVGPPRAEFWIWEVPTPLVPNGSYTVWFQNCGV